MKGASGTPKGDADDASDKPKPEKKLEDMSLEE